MCWNSTSSLVSFITGYTICFILFKRNQNYDRFYALCFFWILLVQLLEYFMWKDQKCQKMNNISNQILCPVIFLQPIIISILALNLTSMNKLNKNLLIIFTIISFIVFVGSYLTMKLWNKNLCSRPKDNECHSLQWPWIKKDTNTLINSINYFLLAFIVFYFLISTKNYYLIFFAVYLIFTLLISLFIKPFNESQYSHWCFLSVGLPLIKLFI
tara:strand:+ start:1236 stop:1874 length:639 start_codon:yes stop_codon:yes gene_type:complete